MIIRSESDHLVVTIGMKETIVVHTHDATLVAPKTEEERVREVVKQLARAGPSTVLVIVTIALVKGELFAVARQKFSDLAHQKTPPTPTHKEVPP